MNDHGHPILSSAEAHELEKRLFGNDEANEWPAMQRAGHAVAHAVLRDFEEIGGFPATGRSNLRGASHGVSMESSASSSARRCRPRWQRCSLTSTRCLFDCAPQLICRAD